MALGLVGLGFVGCVGGQSGTEGLCGERDNKRDVNPFGTESLDEDGGVEDPDGGENEFTSDDGPETASAPAQCLSDSDEH